MTGVGWETKTFDKARSSLRRALSCGFHSNPICSNCELSWLSIVISEDWTLLSWFQSFQEVLISVLLHIVRVQPRTMALGSIVSSSISGSSIVESSKWASLRQRVQFDLFIKAMPRRDFGHPSSTPCPLLHVISSHGTGRGTPRRTGLSQSTSQSRILAQRSIQPMVPYSPPMLTTVLVLWSRRRDDLLGIFTGSRICCSTTKTFSCNHIPIEELKRWRSYTSGADVATNAATV